MIGLLLMLIVGCGEKPTTAEEAEQKAAQLEAEIRIKKAERELKQIKEDESTKMEQRDNKERWDLWMKCRESCRKDSRGSKAMEARCELYCEAKFPEFYGIGIPQDCD